MATCQEQVGAFLVQYHWGALTQFTWPLATAAKPTAKATAAIRERMLGTKKLSFVENNVRK